MGPNGENERTGPPDRRSPASVMASIQQDLRDNTDATQALVRRAGRQRLALVGLAVVVVLLGLLFLEVRQEAEARTRFVCATVDLFGAAGAAEPDPGERPPDPTVMAKYAAWLEAADAVSCDLAPPATTTTTRGAAR